MAFKDFDVEIQDDKENSPEHFNGSVATAGSPVSLSLTSTNPISHAFILNPSKGTNANAINDVLLLNVDNGTTFITIARGESISLPVNGSSIKIDTNNNGTNYEAILYG